MRDRGALCDRIPDSSPASATSSIDGDPTPMRVRFSYLTDDDIRDLARTYGRLRVIDGATQAVPHDRAEAAQPAAAPALEGAAC